MRYSKEYIINKLKEYGYNYIGNGTVTISTKMLCLDKEGYYVICVPNKIFNAHKFPLRVHTVNPYSIQNIKRIVKENTQNEFTCISDDYVNNVTPLLFKHNVCNRIFKNKWINIHRDRYEGSITSNKTGLRCPFCHNQQLESTHALVLKQVWLHEYPNTIVEDKSCINPNTKHCLPTDIVNHELKIAIEIQSWFHDFLDQQAKDDIKKNFWIDKGYSFYAIDQRDYTVLEMINVFFPNIHKIPDYIDFDYANKFNDVKAQELLNKYMSVNKVAKIMKCSSYKIYDAISNNRIVYPDNYKHEDWTRIVQLDLNENYIAQYDSISEAGRMNPDVSTVGISACLNNNRNYCSGYYWIKYNDYISNNYTIAKYRSIKFMKPINQYSMDGKLIRRYNNIIEASKDIGGVNSDIYRVAIGKRKSYKKFIWKFDS